MSAPPRAAPPVGDRGSVGDLSRAPDPEPEPDPDPDPELGPLTEDAFLDGRARLLQPARGYRAATDPVWLAAACPARSGDSVLDMGSGAGAAALCLAARVPGLALAGLELQPAYARLSERNAARNGADWRVFVGDAARPPAALRSERFDHVISNPPFHSARTGPASPDAGRDAAHRETVGLDVWIDACLRRLKPFGSITLIHRAERAPDILSALSGRAGDIRLIPIWPRPGRPARRVVARAIKESRGPFALAPGIVAHPAAGEGYTPDAVAILRDGAALDIPTADPSVSRRPQDQGPRP